MSLMQVFRDIFTQEQPPVAFGAAITAGAATLEQAKPRLTSVRTAPSRDEFAAWRDDPTTKFVLAALLRNAEECRDAWMAASWEQGVADQKKLDGLRERSDALLGFTSSYEAFCETLGLEPEMPND